MTRVTGSQMETPSSDDKIVESAPSGSVKKIKANATNKLKEGADKIEGTKHDLDEVEEGAENEDDENQGATTDNEEEEAEEDEEDDAEEDEEEEAEEDEEEVAEESEKVEEAVTELVTEEKVNKEIDGEVESLEADIITRSKNTETGKEEEGVKNSTAEENMPRKKAIKGRKTATNATVLKEAVKAGEKVVTGFAAEGKGIKENDGPLKSMSVCLVPKSGSPKVGNDKEEKEVIDSTAKEITPIKKKAKRARKKTTANATASKEADKADELLNADKKEVSAVVKKAKLADGMGLIFMCNTKTKQDCFRFKVLGLPASKKELVAKIYKGMRLFLFDVDLKLMYGIFKAVTPGAYDIEPKAFNGAYPAQVRFTVFHDCLPLPEEKFKVALKENYYGRNKFDNKLSQEQVKKLCRLFQNANKKKRTRAEFTGAAEQLTTPLSKRRKRARENDAVRPIRVQPIGARDARKAREPMHPPSHFQKRDPHGRSARRTPPPSRRRERSPAPRRREAYESPRGGRPQDLDMYPRRREAYASPPRRAIAAPAPSAVPYDYYYRQHDPLSGPPPYPSMVDPRERRTRDLEMRQPLASEYRGDGYNMYREVHGHYPDSYYGSGLGLAAAQTAAYVPPASLSAAYVPPAQGAYALAAQAAYGAHPLYYHY